jgi:hypothetical protein
MYQYLSQHRKMAYEFQNDCLNDEGNKFPVVDVQKVIEVVNHHILNNNWEG